MTQVMQSALEVNQHQLVQKYNDLKRVRGFAYHDSALKPSPCVRKSSNAKPMKILAMNERGSSDYHTDWSEIPKRFLSRDSASA